jgi:hypothetical protein
MMRWEGRQIRGMDISSGEIIIILRSIFEAPNLRPTNRNERKRILAVKRKTHLDGNSTFLKRNNSLQLRNEILQPIHQGNKKRKEYGLSSLPERINRRDCRLTLRISKPLIR